MSFALDGVDEQIGVAIVVKISHHNGAAIALAIGAGDVGNIGKAAVASHEHFVALKTAEGEALLKNKTHVILLIAVAPHSFSGDFSCFDNILGFLFGTAAPQRGRHNVAPVDTSRIFQRIPGNESVGDVDVEVGIKVHVQHGRAPGPRSTDAPFFMR